MDAKDALLVIDLQQRYTAPGAPFELPEVDALIDRVNDTALRARARGTAVIWIYREVRPQVGPGRRTTRRYGAGAGDVFMGANAELDPKLEITAEDIVVSKPRQSSFFGSDLDSVLRNIGCERVLLAGVTTNICVLATAQDAAARDYDVVALEDLTASMPVKADGAELMSAAEVQHASLSFIRHGIGEVMTSAEAIPV
jgi:nicotinamidase-related amidase